MPSTRCVWSGTQPLNLSLKPSNSSRIWATRAFKLPSHTEHSRCSRPLVPSFIHASPKYCSTARAFWDVWIFMELQLKSVISKILHCDLFLFLFSFGCRKTRLCRRRSGPNGDIHIFNIHPAELYFEACCGSQRHWHQPSNHQSGKFAPPLWGLFCSTLAKWRVSSSQTHESSGWMTVSPQSVENETLRPLGRNFMERRVLRKENCMVLL